MRWLALLLPVALLCATQADAGEPPNRLGTLLRWYLSEKNPSRREDFLEEIDRIADGNWKEVAAAIREGAWCQWEGAPPLLQSEKLPELSPPGVRIVSLRGSAGRVLSIAVPKDYDPAHAYPLLVDLDAQDLPVLPGAVVAHLSLGSHPEAVVSAQAAESLVLSAVAYVEGYVHVDCDHVILRGERATAGIALHVALHHPDRFAGVMATRPTFCPDPGLAAQAQSLRLFLVQWQKPTAALKNLPRLLTHPKPVDLFFRAPVPPSQKPTFVRWQEDAVRPSAPPRSVDLYCDRADPARFAWVRAVPKERTEQDVAMGSWFHRVLRKPAHLHAEIVGPNTVRVDADGITAFDLYFDPRLFDASKALRVSINRQVPEARILSPNVDDLLEDFRERRDPGRLYPCRLRFSLH